MHLRHPLIALLATALVGLAPLSAAAQDEEIPFLTVDEIKCQKITNNATESYFETILDARNDCFQKLLNGSIPMTVDCTADIDLGTGELSIDDRMRSARAKILKDVTTACLTIELENLGYPGFCEDLDGPPFTAFDQEACIIKHGDELIALLIDFEQPPVPGVILDGSNRNCRDTVARKASRMFVLELEARQTCLYQQLKGNVSRLVDCRAESDRLEPGTGDASTDNGVISAHNKVLQGIANACPNQDLQLLGFPNACPAPGGSVYPLSALTECMFDSHHLEMVRFVDMTNPSSTLCGDGVIDFAEQCDDGNNAHQMGELCRGNCTAILQCGDPDDNGAVTINDALFALKSSVGLASCALELCDVDGNGHVSVVDVLQLLQSVTGLGHGMLCPSPLSLTCGNSVVDEGELCDDGDNSWDLGLSCNASCQLVSCGDPNDSGTITVSDSSHTLRAAIGLAACDLSVCDVDASGAVNTSDVLTVLAKATGNAVELSCPF